MSTPFPLEEQAQLEDAGAGGVWDPWKGPAQPHWYSGMGFNEDTAYLGPLYRALEAAGEGAAKGEELLGGFYHGAMEGYAAAAQAIGSPYLESDAAKGLEEAQSIEQDAQARVRAMTPDAATTGAAVQLLHGVVSGAYRMVAGSLLGGPAGGAALLGGSEAVSRYHELTQQGVDSGTATASAAATGVLQGVGALIPGGVGSSLFGRVASGVGANVGLGLASRYTDHAILELGGYADMAAQERVWDRGQLMADAVLGAAFGGLAHLHATAEQRRMLEATRNLAEASGATDAARVMEVAAADRNAAPGVPADPAAAAAHQAALEKATTDLLQGEPVQVDGTGIEVATLLSRPERASADLGRQVISAAFERANVAGEQASLADLEAQLAARLRGERGASVQMSAPEASGLPKPPQEAPATASEPTFAAGRELSTPEAIAEQIAAASAGERRAPREIAVGQGASRAVIPLEELREAVAAKGFDGFDDAPPEAIAATLREVAAAKLAPEPAAAASPLDLANFGLPEPPRPLEEDHPLLQPQAGNTSPERQAMRERLIEQRFAGKRPVPLGSKPVAILMGGGGASGKGTVLKLLQRQGAIPEHAVHLDPDSFKTGEKGARLEGIPEYHQLVAAGDSRAAAVTHEESTLIYRQALERAVEGRYSLVLDRTLGDTERALAEVQRLKDAGYEVHLIGVTVHPHTAIERAVERAKGPEKRYVPLHALLQAHKGFSAGFERLAAAVHQAHLFDNNVPKGEPPVLIAARRGDQLAIHDAERYNDFARKAGINEQATTLRELAETPERESPATARRSDRAPEELGREDRPGALEAGPGAAGRGGTGERLTDSGGVPGQRVDPLADPATQAVQENPHLEIPGDDGEPVNAAAALAHANQAANEGERDVPKAVTAAVNCFARKGAV